MMMLLRKPVSPIPIQCIKSGRRVNRDILPDGTRVFSVCLPLYCIAPFMSVYVRERERALQYGQHDSMKARRLALYGNRSL